MFRFLNKKQKDQSNILEHDGDFVVYKLWRLGTQDEYDDYKYVKGYYISDEYAIRRVGSYYIIDYIPTSMVVSQFHELDYSEEDALNEARKMAGLPEIRLSTPEHFFQHNGDSF